MSAASMMKQGKLKKTVVKRNSNSIDTSNNTRTFCRKRIEHHTKSQPNTHPTQPRNQEANYQRGTLAPPIHLRNPSNICSFVSGDQPPTNTTSSYTKPLAGSTNTP